MTALPAIAIQSLPVPSDQGWSAPRHVAALAGIAGLAYCFHPGLLAYAADPHYQSHFAFLWAFFAAALWIAGRGRIAHRIPGGARSVVGLLFGLAALALLHFGFVTGSSTAQRLALVSTFTGWALVAARCWSARRCFGYAAFALLCFGVPYSIYFELTNISRLCFSSLLAAVPASTPLDYSVDGSTLVFADYRLDVGGESPGLDRMFALLGLAFLGALTGKSSGVRVAGLFVVGAILAFFANFARLLAFASCVATGHHLAVEEPALRAAVGLATTAPFVLVFVWLILKTHRPRAVPAVAVCGGRGLPVVLLSLPFVGLGAAHLSAPEIEGGDPAYFASLEQPPGYVLVHRAPSESQERDAHATPWLIDAAFEDPETNNGFELFAYLTRNRSPRAVHQIAGRLAVDGTEVSYGPPVEIDGRTFWTVELQRGMEIEHGYFAFWVDGEDLDDRLGTQLAVMRRRVSGLPEVGLTRFLMPGPLVWPIPQHERELLSWRAGHLHALDPHRAASPR